MIIPVRIPIRFMLYGRVVDITHSKTLMTKKGLLGQAKYDEMEIVLQGNVEGAPMKKGAIESNYYHELVHHILSLSGDSRFDPPLHKREWLVDRIAGLLHQVAVTSEYEDENEFFHESGFDKIKGGSKG